MEKFVTTTLARCTAPDILTLPEGEETCSYHLDRGLAVFSRTEDIHTLLPATGETLAHGTRRHEQEYPWQHRSHQKPGNNQVHRQEKDYIISAIVMQWIIHNA